MGSILLLHLLHCLRVVHHSVEDSSRSLLHSGSMHLVSGHHIRCIFKVAPTNPNRSWGAAAMSTGAVHNFTQLIVCRCLLALFEAVFGCGAPYFLSLFYQRKELGFRLSILLGMSPVANCFASALAYGITQIEGSLERWRYIFIIGNTLRSYLMPYEDPSLTLLQLSR